MGAFDVIPNITIPDPDNAEAAASFRKTWGWEPHEQVIMKGTLTAADQEVVGNASSSADKKGNIETRLGSGKLIMLTRMIVDWTFAVQGRKVEVRPDTIRLLPANYIRPLLEKCDELAAGMTEEEQKDFFDSANGHSKESSIAMSTSLSPS